VGTQPKEGTAKRAALGIPMRAKGLCKVRAVALMSLAEHRGALARAKAFQHELRLDHMSARAAVLPKGLETTTRVAGVSQGARKGEGECEYLDAPRCLTRHAFSMHSRLGGRMT